MSRHFLRTYINRANNAAGPSCFAGKSRDYHFYFDSAEANPPLKPVAVHVKGCGAARSRQVLVPTNLRTRNLWLVIYRV
jgi:hypothetical protein